MQILSPLPGIFYLQPSPDEPTFKKAGDAVEIGDVIGLVEVMKSFIEVRAETEGMFQGYVVGNESTVSPGDVIAELED